MDRVITTLIGVAVAVGVSALIFIGANRLFDVAPRRWRWFTAATGGVSAGFVFVIMWGNRVIFENPLRWTLIAVVVGFVVGYLLGTVEDQRARLITGAAGGGLLGLLVGLNMRNVILVVMDDAGRSTSRRFDVRRR